MNNSNFKKNIIKHNIVADKYMSGHKEIYNSEEQLRLFENLKKYLNLINKENKDIVSLDFGAGDGNLTNHLLNLDCEVISADISSKFIERLDRKYYNKKFKSLLITEENKISVNSESVDFIGVYSVLHHIDDYLKIFDEFYRVLKKDGILYIDHENSKSYWNLSSDQKKKYQKFRNHQKKPFTRYLKINNYIDWFIRKFINKKYQREGDIHVWEDDHIDWQLIEQKVLNRFEVITYEEYLLFIGGYDEEIYNQHKEMFNDMGCMVLKKI